MSAAAAVHLACAPLESLLRELPEPRDWLSAAEQVRLGAMKSERRRAQFLAGRWQARRLLADAIGGAAQDWRLDAPADAPPAVIGDPRWQLSISHSGTQVAVALATQAVGIDLEVPRSGRDLDGLAALCCTESEQALLAQAPDREALFHALWTVKESWLKRRREGVAPARLRQLEAVPQDGGAVRTWRAGGACLALCADPALAPRWWTPAPAPLRQWQVRDAACGLTPSAAPAGSRG